MNPLLKTREHEILATKYPKGRGGMDTHKYYYNKETNVYSGLILGRLYRICVSEFILFRYNDILKENDGDLDLMRLPDVPVAQGDMLMFVGWHREETGHSDYPVFLYDGELLEVTGLPDLNLGKKVICPLELVK